MAGFERRKTGVEVRHGDHETTKNNWEKIFFIGTDTVSL